MTSRGRQRDAATLDLVLEVLRNGHDTSFVAKGGSMTAAIPHGSRITLAPTGKGHSLALGDVVAVSTPRVGLVVHRIIGLDSAGNLLIKGDACPGPDGWFRPKDIVGRVVDVEGRPVPPPTPPPPRWRRAIRRLVALFR